MNDEVLKFRKSIINRSFWIAAGLAIALSFFQSKDYALGILVGVFISAVNFFLLSKQILGMQQGMKRNVFIGSFLLRYALLGVCIYFVVQNSAINVFGFLIGFFILQLNIFLTTFLGRKGSLKPTAP